MKKKVFASLLALTLMLGFVFPGWGMGNTNGGISTFIVGDYNYDNY